MEAVELLETPLRDNVRDKGAPLRLVLTYRRDIYSLLCFDVIFIGRTGTSLEVC